jgi:hypothetical protein
MHTLPFCLTGEDRSYDTPSFGGGSGGAAARNAQPPPQEMRPPTHPPTKEEAELRYLGGSGPKGRASVRRAAVKPANVEVGGKGAKVPKMGGNGQWVKNGAQKKKTGGGQKRKKGDASIAGEIGLWIIMNLDSSILSFSFGGCKC